MKQVDNLEDLPGGGDVIELFGPSPDIDGAVAWEDEDGELRVRLWGAGCPWTNMKSAVAGLPASAVVWQKGHKPSTVGRTQAALRLLDLHPEMNPHAAAKQAGVHVSAVYRALQRAARPVCKCCGQRLPT